MRNLIIAFLIIFSACEKDDIIIVDNNINESIDTLKPFIIALDTVQDQTPVFDEVNGVRVFILTGQSNAVGKALNSNLTAGELSAQSQLKIWNKTAGAFQDLDIGTNNLALSTEHGIENGLAQNILTYFPTGQSYLIKWGVGSTEIAQHLSGGAVYTELWNNYVVSGINNIITSGKIPYVYLIYSQGERDANTNDPSPAGEYTLFGGRFDTWVSLWQTNFGTDLPIAVLQVKEPGPAGYEMATINGVFDAKALTESKLNVLQTKSLSSIGDNLHFNHNAHKTAAIEALEFFSNNLGHKVEASL